MRANLLFAALVCIAGHGIDGLLFPMSGGYKDAQQNYYDMMTHCEREGGECIDVDLGGPSPAGPPDTTDPPPTLPPVPPQQTTIAPQPPPPTKPIYNILPSVNPFVPFVPQNQPMPFPQRPTTRAPLPPVWQQPPIPQRLAQFIPPLAPLPPQPTPAPFIPRMAPPAPRQTVPQVPLPRAPPQPQMNRENPRMIFPVQNVPPPAPMFSAPPVAPPMANPPIPPMPVAPPMANQAPPMFNNPPPQPAQQLYFPQAAPQPAPPAPRATTQAPRTMRVIHIERELPESRQKRALGADPLGYLYSECRGGWEFDMGCGNRGGNVCCYPSSARRRRK